VDMDRLEDSGGEHRKYGANVDAWKMESKLVPGSCQPHAQASERNDQLDGEAKWHTVTPQKSKGQKVFQTRRPQSKDEELGVQCEC